MQIDVTHFDIHSGMRQMPSACPVALAAQHARLTQYGCVSVIPGFASASITTSNEESRLCLAAFN